MENEDLILNEFIKKLVEDYKKCGSINAEALFDRLDKIGEDAAQTEEVYKEIGRAHV